MPLLRRDHQHLAATHDQDIRHGVSGKGELLSSLENSKIRET